MNKKLLFVTVIILLAITATTALAGASPYLAGSFWMADPLDPGHAAPDLATPADTEVEGYWWRDTTNQNAIAQHTADEFPEAPFVETVYDGGYTRDKIMVYHSVSGPNVTAIMTETDLWIVGPGGGISEAHAAYMAFRTEDLHIIEKTLKGIILTSVSPEETGGAELWRGIFRTDPPAPIYASAAFPAAKADLDAVMAEFSARQAKVLGRSLPWGADGFLGAGSMKQSNSGSQGYIAPDTLISEPTTIIEVFEYTRRVMRIDLFPTSNRDGGLIVHVLKNMYSACDSNEPVMITGAVGKYLPDAGSIYLPSVPVLEQIGALNQMMNPQRGSLEWNSSYGFACPTSYPSPTTLITAHGLTMAGRDTLVNNLTPQRDALQSIYDQTLTQINQGTTIDEAAAAVSLPALLADNPYNQELVSTIPGIVKNIYQEKMGWFGGNTTDLASTLTEATKAQALASAFGLENLIAAAKNAELGARDLEEAEQALYLAHTAYKAAPDNFSAKQVYAQALRKNAYLQKSAQIRNYYLTIARGLGTEQIVTSSARSGDEDTQIAIPVEDFIQNYSGVGGSTLAYVWFDTLPANGLLSLPGIDENGNPIRVPVSANQTIPLANLEDLEFAPNQDWNGETSFIWWGDDGSRRWSTEGATFSITVNPVNDAPVVSGTQLADVVVDEDAPGTTLDLSASLTDVDGEALTFTVANTNPALLSTSVDGNTLSLAFLANQHGTATISVTAADPSGATVTDDFTVTVNPVNDPPYAVGQEILVTAGIPRAISLDYGDPETPADLNVTISGPVYGTLDRSALPQVTYTANASFTGSDSFTYTVSDGELAVEATVTIQVVQTSLSGRIYNDANANGSMDEGEAGLAGVTVQLIPLNGSPTIEVASAVDGAYAFGSLLPGRYQVRQVLSPGYVQTTPVPADIELVEGQAADAVDFGAVISADLKTGMSATVNNKAIIYVITVTNDGPAEAAASLLTDPLSNGVSFVSVTTSQGTCSGGRTISCSFGSLASGSTATVTLKVNRTSTRIAIVNTARVSSSTFDIDMTDNSATVTIQ